MTGLTDSAEQSFEALRICKRILGETQLTIPTWEALVEGERSLVEDEGHSSQPRHGWPQKQRNAQRNRSSTTPSGRAGQTPTGRAAGPNVAHWRQLCAQRFLPGDDRSLVIGGAIVNVHIAVGNEAAGEKK